MNKPFVGLLGEKIKLLQGELAGKNMVIKQLERERDEWKRAFEVVKAADERAVEADRALHQAIGREEAMATGACRHDVLSNSTFDTTRCVRCGEPLLPSQLMSPEMAKCWVGEK